MDEGRLRVDVESTVSTTGLTVLPAEKRERGQGREMFMFIAEGGGVVE
jgi:hypothetical protein